MRLSERTRRATLVIVVALVLATSAAAKVPPALEEAVAAIARSQAVDEASVKGALASFVVGERQQLKLARTWESTLPARRIPNLTEVASSIDELSVRAQRALESAACSAVIDTLRNNRVPSGSEFVDSYVRGLVPGGLLADIKDAFDELWVDARAGSLQSTDIRLTLMKFQYC